MKLEKINMQEMQEQKLLKKLKEVLTPYLDGLDMQELSKHNRSYLNYSDNRFEKFVRDEWAYYKEIIQWYKDNAKAGETVLDIGTFVPVIPLVLAWEGFKVTTIEKLSLYGGALDSVEKLLSKNDVNFINDDILEYDFDGKKNKYNYVNLLAVVEHLNGSPKVLLEKIQKLVEKSQGKFLFVVPNHARLVKRLSLLVGQSVHPSYSDYWESEYPFTGHNREYTFAESKYALEKSGFNIELMLGIKYPYGKSVTGAINSLAYVLPDTFSHVVFAVTNCNNSKTEKQNVKDFWNDGSCGEDLYLKGDNEVDAFNRQAEERYNLEPYILDFAGFTDSKFSGGEIKSVLEIGVGLGSDHQKFAESGVELSGVDLTERAVEHTKKRFDLLGLESNLQVADAEKLPFKDEKFDKIYSWGVIHHSPNTQQAIKEIFRVLKPSGEARVMIYHTYSFVGYMLWVRYALLRGKPFTSLAEIYSCYLESPGTKAYTVEEAKSMFNLTGFSRVEIDTVLTHGDLLSSQAGQRHEGKMLDIARKMWPRKLIEKLFPKHGLFMLIRAIK